MQAQAAGENLGAGGRSETKERQVGKASSCCLSGDNDGRCGIQSQLVANDCGGWSRHCWSQRMKWLLRKPEITSCEEEGSLSRPALEARFLGGS